MRVMRLRLALATGVGDAANRWVQLAHHIPWNRLVDAYTDSLSARQGRPAKDGRLVIGALIIKHKLGLSDRETVAQIQENPYLQYFVGLSGYQSKAPFTPSLFVQIRKRMGQRVFDAFEQAIVDAVEPRKTHSKSKESAAQPSERTQVDVPQDTSPAKAPIDPEPKESEDQQKTHRGKLIVDATIAPQKIRYPTDLSLLNEARERSEQIIDALYPHTPLDKKPRTYRQNARKAYLNLVKQKRPGTKRIRKAIKQQLNYLRRNLAHIERRLEPFPIGRPLPLSGRLLYRYWVIQHVYAQQTHLYRQRSRRCDDRIVSISQPYVRPIQRGKVDKPTEFGAKLSVSLTHEGIAQVNHIRWNAFHEGHDLPDQVEAYKRRYGFYPEVVLADTVYGSRDNRRYLKQRTIRFAGKPLGRPKKRTEENRQTIKEQEASRREEYRQRIPIEGKFGQGKNGYGLNAIPAKRADTSLAWIRAIFFVMNLLVLIKEVFSDLKITYGYRLGLPIVPFMTYWTRLHNAPRWTLVWLNPTPHPDPHNNKLTF